VTVETPFGEVRMKISRLHGSVLNATPEYEDCRRIAAQKGVALKDVLAAATHQFQKWVEAQPELSDASMRKGTGGP
jgi:hypothetical protein